MDEPADERPQTASRLLPIVYDQVRGVARGLMAREASGHSLQPTALVHEAYLRLSKSDGQSHWVDPTHFSSVLVEVMRRILIESARRKKRLKRGGGMNRQDLDAAQIEDPAGDDSLLALDEAMVALAAINPGWAQLVKLRFYLGLTVPEAAASLAVSPRTADAWWASARAWMQHRLAVDLDDVVGLPAEQ